MQAVSTNGQMMTMTNTRKKMHAGDEHKQSDDR